MTNGALVTLFALALALALGGCGMGRSRAPRTETITIDGPALTPDPTTTSGLAGGAMDASAVAETDVAGNPCVGSIPTVPQHLVHLAAPLPMLRVLVSGEEDTTLVVRGPNGAVYCNDDGGDPNSGINPIVEIASPAAGDYAVYVGAYRETANLSTYAIGLTSTAGTYPSQVVR